MLLDEARTLGLEQVLIVCSVDNLASVKTIGHQGGVLEGIRVTERGPVRRYRISIQSVILPQRAGAGRGGRGWSRLLGFISRPTVCWHP